MDEILALMAADAGVSDLYGPPQRYSLERVQTDTDADIGKWRLLVHPIVDGPGITYWFPTLVRKWPAALISTTTDRADVTEEAAYMISDMAAAEVAAMFGEDREAIASILSGVPEDIQRLLNLSVETVNRPRPRPLERAA